MALLENNGSYELLLPDGDALPSSVMRTSGDGRADITRLPGAPTAPRACDPTTSA